MLIPQETLGRLIEERTSEALSAGALFPIETGCETIEDGGVRFAVRVRKNVQRKASAASMPGVPPRNPFLPPYEPALFVGELSDTHVVLLNKFNVFPLHALIVTRAFEPQESALTLADFEALYRCLSEVDGLCFYNGGRDAGASQPHKHLQLVPFPMVAGVVGTPVDSQALSGTLPFPARVVELPGSAREALRVFEAMSSPSKSWNLLATRRWLMRVPRTRECFEDISVNALGFAGSLFVRDEAQLQRVRAAGPVQVLRSVTT